jgi:hypothetical protein
MDYFSKYLQFPILKNHILKDPLCDWFEIQDNAELIKDDDTYYKEYILKESTNYRDTVLRKILEMSGLDIPLYTTFNQTKELIHNNSPLILQGVLLDKNDIYVSCDIIISYEYFQKLFPNISNIPFHLYCENGNSSYLLIDICYSTLHFRMDLKDVINDGIIPYKKCSMYAFQEVFFELSGERSPCFLLGKEYYHQKTLLPKNEFIAKIKFDRKIHDTFVNAIQWIRLLKDNYHSMSIHPEPSHLELYPNMNMNETNWETEKIKLANRIKEITSVWNVSYEERCDLVKKNIKCWDDPKLLKELKPTKKKDIQERMIHMNQQDDILIHPRKNISSDLKRILETSEYDIYFDVESFLSFSEKTNDSEPLLGILGYIHRGEFFDITIHNFKKEDEKKMVEQFSSQLKKISRNNTIHIYHWGHAEYNYFQYIHKTYPKIDFPKYQLINVLDHFRMEPIIVQGVFKFGLKSVGKALYKHGLIQTTWDENDNGLDAMIQFKELCQNHDRRIPLKRYLEIQDIINYNRIDCQVLYEIVELLRDKYN